MSRTLSDLAGLYRRISFDDASHQEGRFTIASDEDISLLSELTADARRYGVSLIDEIELLIGNTVTLAIGLPRMQLGYVCETLDDLLKNPQNRTMEPDSYYIFQLDYLNSETNPPELIVKYRTIIKLLDLLKESAAYMDSALNELVYFDEDTVKIPIKYNSADVLKINIKDIESILSLFTDDTHRTQKLTILANSVKAVCSAIDVSNAFPVLLSDVPGFNDKIRKGYRIFVSGFSYDKIIDQLKAAKVEEFGKIHKVFSDIQNQLLGIPVSTLIVATQMKQAHGWDIQAITNTAIVIGSIIFTALVLVTLFNQMQTLITIKDEIAYKKKQANKLYKAIYEDICITFDEIDNRIWLQKAAIWTARVILGVSLLYSLYIYAILTY